MLRHAPSNGSPEIGHGTSCAITCIMFRCRFPSTRRSATYAVTPHCAVIPGSKSRRLPNAGQRGSGRAPPKRAELGLRPPERSSSPRRPVCAGTERRGPCKTLVATRGHALLGLIQNACNAPSLTPTLPPSRHPDACIVKARRGAVQAFSRTTPVVRTCWCVAWDIPSRSRA